MARLPKTRASRSLFGSVSPDYTRHDDSRPPMRVYDLRFDREPGRGPAAFVFQWESPARAIAAVAVSLATRLGRTRQVIAARAAGIAGSRGTGRISIDLTRLPAGSADVHVTPLDCDGREGTSADFAFEVPSCGLPRKLELWVTPSQARLRRPRNQGDLVYARFRIHCEEDERATALFVSVRGPDGTEDTLAMPPPRGDGATSLFALSSSHQPGSYTVTLHMVDRSGTIGTAAEAVLELAVDKGKGCPIIDSVESRDGRRISILGSSLNKDGLQVKFGSITAAVIEATASRLLVETPDLDEPVRIMVRTAQGVAWSPRAYEPSVRVRVVPEEFELAQGASAQFTAIVNGTRDGRVRWELRSGGTGTRISRTGKLSASLTCRAGTVTVIAKSLADPSAVGQSAGRLIPFTGTAGRGVLGSLGGTVRAADGGACIRVPARSLSEAARISLRTESARSRAEDDFITVAQVDIRGDRCKFKTPALLEVPLQVPLQPGYEPYVQVARGRGRWQTLDVKVALDRHGHTAELPVDEIPKRLRLNIPWKRDHGIPRIQAVPTIQGIGPNMLHEGSTAAVLVTGSNFVPGVTTVDVIDGANRIESRIAIRSVAVTADGTKAGVGLKVGVMTNVGEGELYNLKLRVTTPAGSAEFPLTIIGHDELDVQSGTRTLNSSQTFSRMEVHAGARLNVSNVVPPVAIDCHEVAEVASTIESGGGVWVVTGNGAPGAPGDAGGLPGFGGAGVGPLNIGGGGSGGAGATGSGGIGRDGVIGRPSSVNLTLAGTGGKGGAAGGGGIFPHAGGDGTSGTRGRRSNFVPGLIDLEFEPGPGGGGGGGGGGEGWIFQNTGAGGSGGGAGGGALRLSAGEEIHITGDILANGGEGPRGEYPVTVVAPAAPYLIQAGCSGGGGGGAGGYLLLQGVTSASGTVFAAGGKDGSVPRYGIPPVDARTFRQMLLDRPETGTIRIDGQVGLTRGNTFRGPDLAYVYNLLTTSAQVEVTASGADAIEVVSATGSIRFFDVPTNPAVPDRAVITLSEGLNTVRAHWTGAGMYGQPIMSCAAIRERRFLYLPNTIPAYEFACTVSPAQAQVATERSIYLTATVVARPPTAVSWSLAGGPGRIIVTPFMTGAQYVAPTIAPASAVEVRAVSTLDPSRFASAFLSVLQGIEVAGAAATGSPVVPGAASANIGGTITISIPTAVRTLTGQGFVPGQPVEFELTERSSATGLCVTRRVSSPSSVDPGMASLTIQVPPCASPDQLVRVPGHGSARLLVVPEITSVEPDQSNFPEMSIHGSGFACGQTEVIFITGPVAAAQIISVACDLIRLSIRPPSGSEIRVRTAGGISRGFAMP